MPCSKQVVCHDGTSVVILFARRPDPNVYGTGSLVELFVFLRFYGEVNLRRLYADMIHRTGPRYSVTQGDHSSAKHMIYGFTHYRHVHEGRVKTFLH